MRFVGCGLCKNKDKKCEECMKDIGIFYEKEDFNLHKVSIMLDRCEDDLKVALEYLEAFEEENKSDSELRGIQTFLTKFVRKGGIDMLQAINFMLYQKEKLEEGKMNET